MPNELVCWKCGASLSGLSLPLRRLEACPRCRAELHVCRLCVQFDRQAYQQCREPTVEEVRDKTRANFCDYFKPRPGAWDGAGDAAASAARSQLEQLFKK